MKKLVIEKNLLIDNINKLKSHTSSTIIATLKNNGYGLGLSEYPKILLENGIDFFAVATFEEAITLRNNGFTNKIMLLHSNGIKEQIKTLIENNIILTIGSFYTLSSVLSVLSEIDKTINVQLKIDSGFGRFGFSYNELPKLVEELKKTNKLNIVGTFSHFSMSFNPKPAFTKLQFNEFMKCVNFLKENDMNTGLLHICNSSAFLKYKDMHLDCVRIGSAFLGRILVPNDLGLNKIGHFEASIEDIKTLPQNHFIGYSNTYKTTKETKIGIIPVGYLDGFMVSKNNDCFRFNDILREIVKTLKSFNKKIYVEVAEKKCQILGKIGTNNITIDITNIENPVNAILDINPMYVNPTIEREFC
ncbi:MAG: alanine racemase [Clostridia bacterium]|nr:alanine racemase [Clostridia bacterium]